MHKHFVALAIVSQLATIATTAGAKDLRRFTPDGEWIVDHAGDRCRVTRSFKDGASEATLILERNTPGDGLAIALASKDIDAWRGARKTSVRFGIAGEQHAERALFRGKFADGRNYFSIPDNDLVSRPELQDWISLETEELARLLRIPTSRDQELQAAATVARISIDGGFRDTMQLETGSLAEPVAAIYSCLDDVVRSWGLDPEVQRNVTVKAYPADMKQLIEEFIYPMEALMRGQDGSARIRVMIDAEGRPTDCSITGPGGPRPFLDEACRTMMFKGRFDPALDAGGRPVASFYSTTVVFAVH